MNFVESNQAFMQGLSGVSKAGSSRGMPASGECQMLLAKAIEGDKEREVGSPSARGMYSTAHD